VIVERPAAEPAADRRIAYLTYSTAAYDSRTQRMAASAIEAGYEVVVYARWEPGVPLESEGPGYRIRRAPVVAELAIPGLRDRGRRRLAAIRAGSFAIASEPAARRPAGEPATERPLLVRWTGTIVRTPRRWRDRLSIFPIRPVAWAIALEEIAEPADLWHGMWAGSLPALDRLRGRFGGRTVYDSRDVYIQARGFGSMSRPWKWLLGWIERRWARRCDAVLTVNDAYAGILERQFDIDRPAVVRNTPARYVPSSPPDRLRERLGLPATTAVVLYQGGLMTERGIEQGMEAILHVPGAILVLMGYGAQQERILSIARGTRFRDRVRVVEPVPPSELLEWTASSDVMLMAIQPTTLNHRYTTPNKLWEAMAAGVPVVASDLPGMAAVVRETGCGVLVDPVDPADIARGIREILALSTSERQALRERCRSAARTTYNWESQVGVLLALYDRLLRTDGPARGPIGGRTL
jgi:glycosyltransferase involved in cell wall biosynthesis